MDSKSQACFALPVAQSQIQQPATLFAQDPVNPEAQIGISKTCRVSKGIEHGSLLASIRFQVGEIAKGHGYFSSLVTTVSHPDCAVDGIG